MHLITLHSRNSEGSGIVDALVDRGAPFATLPAEPLDRHGVVPHRVVRLRLTNSTIEERQVGNVVAEAGGIEESVICIFCEADTFPVIGAHRLPPFLMPTDPAVARLVSLAAFDSGAISDYPCDRKVC